MRSARITWSSSWRRPGRTTRRVCEAIPPTRRKPTFELMQKWTKEEKFVEVANPSVLHVQGRCSALTAESWIFLEIESGRLLFAEEGGVQFVCSDNPISIRSSTGAVRALHPARLAYQGTDFILPIHRRVALLGRFEGRAEVHDVGDEVVAAINTRTMSSARRYIFAPEPSSTSWSPDGTIVPGSRSGFAPRPRQPDPATAAPFHESEMLRAGGRRRGSWRRAGEVPIRPPPERD